MNNDQELSRRRFMRTAQTAAGALACPWSSPSARASETGRAVIGFQLPPDGMLLLNESLREMRTNDQPDLGAKPVVMPNAAGGMAIDAVAASRFHGGALIVRPNPRTTTGPTRLRRCAR